MTVTPVNGSGRPAAVGSERSAMARLRARAQQLARHHHAMDLGRALADPLDAQLAVPTLQRHLAGDAHAAEDLDAAIDHLPGDLGRIDLADRGIDFDVVAQIAAPG